MTDNSSLDKVVKNYVTDPLSREGYLGTAIYINILIILAITGNILVICAFLKSEKLRRNSYHWLLINVAVADLGISLFGYTCAMSSGYAGRWLFGEIGCTVYGFICFTFSQTDMNTLAVLAIYRYVIVCKPEYKHKLSIPNTKYIILLTWLYSILWSGPPLVGWSKYVLEPFGTSCSIDWASTLPADIAYTVVLCFTCYGFHLAIFAVCYLRVWKVWMSTTANLTRHKQWNLNRKTSQAGKISLVTSMKLNKRLALVSFVFVVIWSPYVFVCIWSVCDPTRPGWITTLPTMFAKSTCALNPLMYAALNEHFRKTITSMLHGSCKRQTADQVETLDLRQPGTCVDPQT